ncbi:PAS domain S-box protein [Sporomusa aerivorans]|uniref:PAS domain-containing sensor histidine kinase n=1 Tax=Sporomusa aerivorans TaxID=204936 RepID=UPI00352B9191
MNLTDLITSVVQLLENLGAMALVLLLFLHHCPAAVSHHKYEANARGFLLFALLGLISLIPVLEIPSFTPNLSMVPVILTSVYVGLPEAALVGLLTSTALLVVGGYDWIPWAAATPCWGLIAAFMRNIFYDYRPSWRLGMATLVNCLFSLNIYILANSFYAGATFSLFSKPNALFNFFIPLTVASVAGATLLNWLIVYFQQGLDAQKKLLQAEARYRRIVDSSLVGIYTIQGNKLTYVNRGFSVITNRSGDQLSTIENIYDHVHPDDRELVRENIRKRVTREQEQIKYEMRLCVAGAIRHVEVHGSYIDLEEESSVIGTMIDITDRKQAELELARSEARLRAIIAAVPDMVTVIDKNGILCEVLSTNEMSPLSAAHRTTNNINELFEQCSSEELLQQIRDVLKLQTVRTFEHRNAGQSVLEIRLSPINASEVVAIVRDITARKQTEENYRLTMERYQSLFNSSNDAIFVLPVTQDRQATFLEVNDNACKRLGYSRDELLQMFIFDITEWPDQEMAKRSWQQITQSGHDLIEVTHIAKDGTRIPVEINSHLFKLWGTPRIIAVARDISERRQVETALRESEERFRYLANHIPILLWMDDQDGNCIFVNKQWQEYTGKLWRSGTSIDCTAFIHPKDRQLVKYALEKARGWREKFSYEYRLLSTDGEYRWVQAIGIPWYNPDESFAGFIGCCLDVHDKKLTDRVLKHSYKRLEKSVEEQSRQLANANATLAQEIFVRRAVEKRYRQLFDSVQDAIFVWKITSQGLPGKIIEVNDVACRRLGYTREDLLSLSMLETMSQQSRITTAIRMEKLVASRQTIFELEQLDKHGNTTPSEVNAHLFALNGELVGLCIARDISDRKQAESELLAARIRISKTEKLAFLGNMAAGIAHEINQPLNSIKVTADSILMWAKEGQTYNWEEFLDDIQTISDQSARIANIIKYIRDLIRSNQQANSQVFSLTKAIANATHMLQSQLDAAGVTLSLKLLDDPLEICGSLAHMEHVLLNLITNALDALVSLQQLQREIEIETLLEDRIIVKISDNGPGISEAVKQRMFTPFFTTKSTGMGLGLAIVKSVITSHNGQITVDNNDRGGATFRLEFPLIEDGVKEDHAS